MPKNFFLESKHKHDRSRFLNHIHLPRYVQNYSKGLAEVTAWEYPNCPIYTPLGLRLTACQSQPDVFVA